MKNPKLVEDTKAKICEELNNAGFRVMDDLKYSPDLFDSMKDFVETQLIYRPDIYSFLVERGLLHVDYCLLCGEALNQRNTVQFTFSNRHYNLCNDCYDKAVPSNKSGKKEGCYIATMVYGDYDHPQVIILRNFRDNSLRPSITGRKLIEVYYRVSPEIVKRTKHFPIVHRLIRTVLNQFIKLIN